MLPKKSSPNETKIQPCLRRRRANWERLKQRPLQKRGRVAACSFHGPGRTECGVKGHVAEATQHITDYNALTNCTLIHCPPWLEKSSWAVVYKYRTYINNQPRITMGKPIGDSNKPEASISSILSAQATSLSSSCSAIRRTAASCRLTRAAKWVHVWGGGGTMHSSSRSCRAWRACWKRSIRSASEFRSSWLRLKGMRADTPRPLEASFRPRRNVSAQKRSSDAPSSTITTSSTW
mmetsp:Transcript_41093/g.73882  ORF Transcript_41093/g.73882 Transcript_41093/m.73882 type:complete len:235 (+) Transcript_41093:365-1069(+)